MSSSGKGSGGFSGLSLQVGGGGRRKKLGAGAFGAAADAEQEGDDGREYVSELGAGGRRGGGSAAKKEDLVIPLPAKMAERMAASGADADGAEAKVARDRADVEAENAVIREARGEEEGAGEEGPARVIPLGERPQGSAGGQEGPLLLRNQVPGLSELGDDKERLRHDLKHRSENVDVRSDAYERVPIAEFGKALLRGMGYKEPGGEGQKEGEKKPYEVKARPHRLGLGATPKLWEQKEKRRVRPGEERKRHHGALEEGAVVGVREGRYRGHVAHVRMMRGVPGLNQILVALDRTGAEVRVPKAGVTVLDSQETSRRFFDQFPTPAHRAPEAGYSERPRTERPGGAEPGGGGGLENGADDSSAGRGGERRRRARSRSRDRSSSRRAGRDEQGGKQRSGSRSRSRGGGERRGGRSRGDGEDKSGRGGDSGRSGRQLWLYPGIRVRVVAKRGRLGRYYKEKGVVQDVPDPAEAVVMLGDGKMLDGVPIRSLETALPKAGGRVRVVLGPHKGMRGVLLDRSSKTGVATVHLDENIEAVRLSLDDVAEDAQGIAM